MLNTSYSNEVALRANEVLRNEVALRANGIESLVLLADLQLMFNRKYDIIDYRKGWDRERR